MKTKKLILKNLKNTYCRLQRSRIDGIGVFAIRDIPKGAHPFQSARNPKWIRFEKHELKNLDIEIKKMVEDFYSIEEDTSVYIPECGLDNMDISFFLNHSKTPNIETNDGGLPFKTKRRIKKGEELTSSYETFDHTYKTNAAKSLF